MRPVLNSSSFVTDNLFTVFRQLFGMAATLGASVVIARGLGTEGRGAYQLALLLPSLLIVFTNFGIPSAAAYYVASKEYDIRMALRDVFSLSIFASILAIIAGSVLLTYFYNSFFSGVYFQSMVIALSLVPFLMLNNNLSSILHGIEDFRAYNLVALLPQVINFIPLILFVWVLDGGVAGALVATGLSNFVSIIILFILLRRRMVDGVELRLLPSKECVKLLNYGVKSFVGNAIAFMIYRVDVLILNYFVGLKSVGVYAVAVGLAEKMWVVSTSASLVLFPKIASLERSHDKTHLTNNVAKGVWGINIAMGVILFVVAEPVVGVLFGEEYAASAKPLRYIIPGVMLFSVSRVLANDLAGRKRPGLNTIHASACLIINIVLNILLIPEMDNVGAALASSIAYSVNCVLATWIYCRVSGAKWQNIFIIGRADIKSAIDFLSKRGRIARR